MGFDTTLTRKQLLISTLAAAGAAALPNLAHADTTSSPEDPTLDDLAAMERVIGFTLTPEQRKSALATTKALRAGYDNLRKHPMPNAVGHDFVESNPQLAGPTA